MSVNEQAEMPADSAGTVDQTLSVAAAASRLGVVESTVRRWIKRGRLVAVRVERPQGHEYRIPLDALATVQAAGISAGNQQASEQGGSRQQAAGTNGAAVSSQTSDAAIRDALALVREKDQQFIAAHEQIGQLSGQVGFLQAKLQDSEAQNQQLQDQIKLLQAPPAEQDEGDDPDPEPTPRRWWHRLWPWKSWTGEKRQA
ncbi:MAG: hypothetical protein CMJ87_04380 [Planctomycetes bacterium]|nr:hypothetical protein [Planctomycetota bacterium]